MVSSERPPGSPAGIRALAAVWRGVAKSAEETANTLDSAKADVANGTLKLQGDFTPKVTDALDPIPGELRRIVTAYNDCANAVDKYAGTLQLCQSNWDREALEVDSAGRSRRHAELDLDYLAPGWTSERDPALDENRMLNAQATGQPDLTQQIAEAWQRFKTAQAKERRRLALQAQARQMRDAAEVTCQNEINAALDRAEKRNANWLKRGLDKLKDSIPSWDDFVKFCENASMILGVLAMFAGPLAPILGGLALALSAVVVADKAMKFAKGEISLKEMGLELGMVVLNKVGGKAVKGAFKAYKKTGASKLISGAAHRGADKVLPKRLNDPTRNKVPRDVCKSTGHPVDIATGKVFTSFTDLELPGPLPFVLDRVWFSTSKYDGPFGHGWHHSFDAAVLLTPSEIVYRTPDGRFVDLMYLMPGETVYDRQERLTIARDEIGFRISDVEGISRRFTPGTARIDDPTEPVVFLLRDVLSRAGHRISCAYDESDRLVEIIDSAGRMIGFTHDDAGRITAVTAPHPDAEDERFTVASFSHDLSGNLATAVDARGYEFRYQYEGHLLVEETDRTGLTFHFRYDGVDETARCTSTWGDGDLYRRTLSYEPDATVVIDSLGHATRSEHVGGLVVRTIDALGGERRTEYDYAQPVQEIDPLGRATKYLYDWRGNLIEVTTPDGAKVTVEFDDADQPVRSADQVGGDWTWQYDDQGLLTSRRDPLHRETRLEYARGLLETIIDPAGGRTTMRYDTQGSLVEVVTPDGASSRWERNALGWPTATIDPLGNAVRRTFDLGGNITRVDEPDGNVRTLDYDGESNLTSAEDVLYDVKLAYQGMGRLASRTQAGTTVRFEYDTEEQLVGIVNEHGYVYSFAYNEAGLVKTERGFDDILRIYERDIAGRVVSVRRASGLVTVHEYDDADRVTQVRHSDGSSQRFSYRTDGALMLAGNDTVDVVFERDVMGRLLRETQGKRWVASEYDILDNRTRMFSSMGADQRYTRNAMGDVMSVEGNGYSAEFTRDALGQELTRSLPGGAQARWHRDRLGRPVKQEITGGDGQQLRTREYEWVAGGRLRGIFDSLSGLVRYAHDGLGQLVSATHGDGTVELRMPDAVGNLFKTEDRSDRGYGAAGQVLWLIDDDGRRVDYAYDPEGNLISKTADDGERWEYGWYAAGNMKSVLRPDGTEVTFTYDALSRRMSKTFRGQTTRWVWNGDVILHEWVEGELLPAPARASAIAAKRDEPLNEVLRRGASGRGEESSPITWLFDAETFSPAARLDRDGPSPIFVDNLGTPISALSPPSQFRYAGQYDDKETGLWFNLHRYYDPSTGQYISPDPIGISGGLRLLNYVLDPTLQTDPLGLSTISGSVAASSLECGARSNVRNPTTNLASGNSRAAQRGREIHGGKEWDAHLEAMNYLPSKTINDSTLIPDGFTREGRFPVELKPATRSGIKAGTRQLKKYMRQMNVDYGELWVYADGPGGVEFSLAAIAHSRGRRKWLRP